jgi:hypothetical protein
VKSPFRTNPLRSPFITFAIHTIGRTSPAASWPSVRIARAGRHWRPDPLHHARFLPVGGSEAIVKGEVAAADLYPGGARSPSGNHGGNDASAAAFCCARALDSRRRRPLSAWSTGHRQANNARETEKWTGVSASQGSERAPGKLTELAHMSAQRFSGQSVREIQPRQWVYWAEFRE